MPLCREAVLGPGVYAGFGIRPSRTVPIGPLSGRQRRRDGGPISGPNASLPMDPSELACRTGFQTVSKFDRLQASYYRTGLIPLRGEGR